MDYESNQRRGHDWLNNIWENTDNNINNLNFCISDSDGDEDRTSKGSSKKERYFWQYNVQAKGPKGQRLVLKSKMEDPHHLNEVTDPVFSPDCSVRGIKHSGKARKGSDADLFFCFNSCHILFHNQNRENIH